MPKRDSAEKPKVFVPGPGYTKEDWDAVDFPDLTDEELATAKPFAELYPELAEKVGKRDPKSS